MFLLEIIKDVHSTSRSSSTSPAGGSTPSKSCVCREHQIMSPLNPDPKLEVPKPEDPKRVVSKRVAPKPELPKPAMPKPELPEPELPKPDVPKPGARLSVMPVHQHCANLLNPDDTVTDYGQVRQ